MNIFRRVLLSFAAAATLSAMAAGIADLPIKTINGKPYHYYEVQPKETLYSLQHKLGIDRDEIIKYNPSVIDGLLAYQTLYFPADAAEARKQAAAAKTHEVQKGETIYGISKRYGMTPDELIALNPQIADGLKAGVTLKLAADKPQAPAPAAKAPATPVEAAPVAVSPTPATPAAPVVVAPTATVVTPVAPAEPAIAEEPVVIEEVTHTPTTVTVPEEKSSISIAVMLPFMLKEANMSKAASRYTEFYKGILLAVDTLKSKTEPVTIYAYDTAASSDTLKKILRAPELREVDLIIAPPDEAQLATVARFAHDNDIMVINPFLPKDESYLKNTSMMQTNTPTPVMLRKAVDGLMSIYGDRIPVILTRKSGQGEHNDFAQLLRDTYAKEGRQVLEITYNDALTAASLAKIKSAKGDLIFIPTEGKKAEIDKVLPVLAEYRESLIDPDRVMVLGFPDWIRFRGDTRSNMNKLNTVIYSRLYDDDESLGNRIANEQFRYWYGSAPEAALPKQGLLGLDLGMYLIRALRNNQGDFDLFSPKFDGVQNGYHFVHPESGDGWVNDVIYFINYRPTGIVDKTQL